MGKPVSLRAIHVCGDELLHASIDLHREDEGNSNKGRLNACNARVIAAPVALERAINPDPLKVKTVKGPGGFGELER